VHWKPFYLYSNAPKQGIGRKSGYIQKYGPDQSLGIFERVHSAGAAVGLDIKFGGKTGSSRDSHRLIWFAGIKSGPEMQWRLVDGIFRAYFEEEMDVTEVEGLVRVAVKAGLDDSEIREVLMSGEDVGGQECDEEVRRAREDGVTGVPRFTINERFEVEGAQEELAFVRLFERVVRLEERGRL
jgi:predicted DsbA family dithiol-disulfide isomerase